MSAQRQRGGFWRGEESRVFPLSVVADTGPQVRDLPARPIPVVAAHLTMSAARQVAAAEQTSLLLVERDDQIAGLIDGRLLSVASDSTEVAAAMKPLVPTLRPSMSLGRARALFMVARAAVLPVVAGGFVLGAIARGDVEEAIARAAAERETTARSRRLER